MDQLDPSGLCFVRYGAWRQDVPDRLNHGAPRCADGSLARALRR